MSATCLGNQRALGGHPTEHGRGCQGAALYVASVSLLFYAAIGPSESHQGALKAINPLISEGGPSELVHQPCKEKAAIRHLVLGVN